MSRFVLLCAAASAAIPLSCFTNAYAGRPNLSRDQAIRLIAEVGSFSIDEDGPDDGTFAEIVLREASDAHLQAIAALGTVRRLRVVDSPRIREDAFRDLRPIEHLNSLEIEDTPIGPEALRWIGKHEELTTLILNRCQIETKNLAPLRTATRLERLVLTRNRLTDDGVEELSLPSSIIHINLRDTGVAHGWTKMLCQMPNLGFIDLSNTKCSLAEIRGLLMLKKLRYLWVEGLSISDDDMAVLSELNKRLIVFN